MDKTQQKKSIDINAVNELFLDLICKDDIMVIKNMVENGFNIDNFYFEKEYGINAIIKAYYTKYPNFLTINDSLIYLLGLEKSLVLSEDNFSLLFSFGKHNSKATEILKYLIEKANIKSERTFVEATDTKLSLKSKDNYIKINSQNLFKYKGFNPKLYVSANYACLCKDDLRKINAQSYCVVGLNKYNLNENPDLDLFKLAQEESNAKLEKTEFIKKERDTDVDMNILDFLSFCELMKEFENADIIPFSEIDRELAKKLENEFKSIESTEFNSPEEVMNCMDSFIKKMTKELSNIKKANKNTESTTKVDEINKIDEESKNDKISNDTNDINDINDINDKKEIKDIPSSLPELKLQDDKKQYNNLEDKEDNFLEVVEIEALVKFKNLKNGSIKEEVFNVNSVKDLELKVAKFEEEFKNNIMKKDILSKNIINEIEKDDTFAQELMEFMKNKGRL